MTPVSAIVSLAALAAVVCTIRRRRRVGRVDVDNEASEVSARELVDTRLAVLSEQIRASSGDGIAMRDAQARWTREQALISAESIITTVQGVRALITHAVAVEARSVLDDLEREAAAHPEGVPGYVVAAGRVRFDELMRRNVQ